MHPFYNPTPAIRFRRLRRTPALRALAQETSLSVGDLIWPVFVRDGSGVREPIASLWQLGGCQAWLHGSKWKLSMLARWQDWQWTRR